MAHRVHDVAIVGFGPVGAMMALFLKSLGVSVLILERNPTIVEFPKAAHFDDEIIRLYQAVGLSHLSENMEVPPRYQYYDKDWRPFLARLFPQGISEQGYHHDYMFYQPDVERAMRDKLATGSNAPTLALGYSVESISQTDDLVEITATNPEGVSGTFEARYVVGCDGAKSTVRKIMSSEYERLAISRQWFIVDVKLTGDVDPGHDQWELCDPERIVTYIPLSGPYRRYEFDVKEGETDENLSTEEKTWELLSRWLKPGDAAILRKDIYHFHSLIAKTWRDRRLMIAGDAAHLMTPKMGQGLCTGIRDTANLAWKLALIIKQGADQALLDTYQSERKAPAQEYIELSAYLVEQIVTKAQSDGEPVENTLEEIKAPKQRLHIGNEPETEDELVGTLSAQPTLSDGTRFDDLVGYRFSLLVHPSAARDADAKTRAALKQLNAAVVLAEDQELQAYLRRIDRNGVLIRPDRYIQSTLSNNEDINALSAKASFASLCAMLANDTAQVQQN